MRRIKTTEISSERSRMLKEQGGTCALCRTALSEQQAVLDHDHGTGAIRAVLHRGCNALLGKLENNAARYGVRDIGVFANGVAQYLRTHLTNITGLLHPTHKTPEEKRIRINMRARAARAKKKETE